MKLITCFLLSALALLAQQPQANQPPAPPETKPEDLCSIEGQVTSAATGAPVRKAEITLRGSERATAGTMPASYTTTADAGGNFTIKDVEPGKYRLWAHHSGFVSLQYGARGPNRSETTVSLGAGQRMKDLTLRLTPQSVITGRIVDEKNEPIVSASVRTMRYRYQMGKRQLLPTGSAVTNDLGILESLLTHPPRPTDPYDSITRHVKRKLALLNNRFSLPIDYKQRFTCSPEKVWEKMYSYRSQVAHGGAPDFVGNLAALKSGDDALALLTEATKAVVRQALVEPQLIIDLRGC